MNGALPLTLYPVLINCPWCSSTVFGPGPQEEPQALKNNIHVITTSHDALALKKTFPQAYIVKEAALTGWISLSQPLQSQNLGHFVQ